MPRVYANVYGGLRHGDRIRYRPRRHVLKGLHVVRLGDEVALADIAWPQDKILECLALRRMFGQEAEWPYEVRLRIFGPREGWPWFVAGEMPF